METLPAICFCFYFEEDGRTLFPSAPSFWGRSSIPASGWLCGAGPLLRRWWPRVTELGVQLEAAAGRRWHRPLTGAWSGGALALRGPGLRLLAAALQSQAGRNLGEQANTHFSGEETEARRGSGESKDTDSEARLLRSFAAPSREGHGFGVGCTPQPEDFNGALRVTMGHDVRSL